MIGRNAIFIAEQFQLPGHGERAGKKLYLLLTSHQGKISNQV